MSEEDCQDETGTEDRAGAKKKKIMKGPLLSLIRHPETIANLAGIYQGSTDSPLSVHGNNQLRALANAISVSSSPAPGKPPSSSSIAAAQSPLLVDRPPTRILTSPLGRTRSLAEAIRDAQQQRGNRQVVYEVRPGMAERCFGAQEGSSTSSRSHLTGFPRGKGPKESDVAWSGRVRAEAEYIRTLVATSIRDEKNKADEKIEQETQREGKDEAKKKEDETDIIDAHIVVISHGMWINRFLRQVLASDGQTKLPFTSNTGIFTLTFDGRAWRLIASNDVSHLVGLKRQRGGIGSSASDKRQRTLESMFAAKK